jgi:hypothetical protein
MAYFIICYGLPSLSSYLKPRYRIPLEEATVSHLVKNVHRFYVNPSFIIVITGAFFHPLLPLFFVEFCSALYL